MALKLRPSIDAKNFFEFLHARVEKMFADNPRATFVKWDCVTRRLFCGHSCARREGAW
jgi:hypothetical protein